jgi:hypothetical protein
MSLEHSPTREKRAGISINDPSYTPDEFCAAERMSRSALYKLWKEGRGPDYYLNGVSRRITHRARLAWQDAQVADAHAARETAEQGDA